jgi:hypothetical protein
MMSICLLKSSNVRLDFSNSAADEVPGDYFLSKNKLSIPDVCTVRTQSIESGNASRFTNENGSSKKDFEQKRQNDFATARSKIATRKPAKYSTYPSTERVDVGRLLEPPPERPRALLWLLNDTNTALFQ